MPVTFRVKGSAYPFSEPEQICAQNNYRAKCQYSLLSISYQACHFLMCVQYPICPIPISNGWDIHLEYTSHLTINRIQRKKSEIQHSEMCKMKSLITARNSDWTTDNAQQNVSFGQSLPWMAQHFVWLFTNVKKKLNSIKLQVLIILNIQYHSRS